MSAFIIFHDNAISPKST